MAELIKYIIMSFLIGFAWNKIFNKKDKTTINSIRWGCIIGSVLLTIHLILVSMKK